MGPQSLKALSQLPLAGIEFASLGGTNFATLELLRETTTQDSLDPLISLTKLGHSAKEMIDFWTSFQTDKRAKSLASWHVIISGGRGHDVIDDVVLFKKIQKNHQCSIGLGYSILAQAYQGEKKAMEWLRKYLKTFYFINNFTTLKSS